MEYQYVGCNLTKQDKKDIFEILCQCDNEFYPRLSSRHSTSQNQLKITEKNKGDKPYTYFEDMVKQDFIIVREGEKIVAFMTFKKNYVCDAEKEIGPSTYVSTVCVRKAWRHQGILNRLYEELEHVTKELGSEFISTRTWSLNRTQIHTLKKHGYKKISVIANERGNGVDTVYFGKKMEKIGGAKEHEICSGR